jgi:uncharacterized NAD-dependent epimerase/dehydratase family protein
MLKRDEPLAIYMEGATDNLIGKMGFGILRYSPNPIACVIDSERAGEDAADVTGIPRSAPIVASVKEAVEKGAKVLILGTAPPGGLIPAEWYPAIDEAIASGLSIVNGLHDLLAPRYRDLQPGQYIWDVRVEPKGIGVATGAARYIPNKRVLMIGTDMGIGKMTTGLELYRSLKEHGVRTEFVATGQIGITITGRGIPLDAVRVDYAGGAMEKAVLEASQGENGEVTEVVIVEGQGALAHPGSSANLPLIRGTMPTHLVLCHKAGQTHLQKVEDVEIPPLSSYIRLYEDLATVGGLFPRPLTVGIALNTSHLDDHDAICAMAKVERETGLMTVDPVRFGPDRLANTLMGLIPQPCHRNC